MVGRHESVIMLMNGVTVWWSQLFRSFDFFFMNWSYTHAKHAEGFVPLPTALVILSFYCYHESKVRKILYYIHSHVKLCTESKYVIVSSLFWKMKKLQAVFWYYTSMIFGRMQRCNHSKKYSAKSFSRFWIWHFIIYYILIMWLTHYTHITCIIHIYFQSWII